MFVVSRGVPSIVFMVLFAVLAGCSAYLTIAWGRRTGFLKLTIFTIVRLGACICGIIVAAQNFSNTNVIVAEIVLSSLGSFMIYFSIVAFYDATARYFNFWQGATAALIRKLQSFSLLVLVALAIASGAEGSDFTDPSSIDLAQNLSKAYSIIFMFCLLVNIFQWGAIWHGGNIQGDTFSVFVCIGLFFVFLKAIYLIASSFILSISLRDIYINAGWYSGAVLAPDFLSALFCVIAGFVAPKDRREAMRNYVNELAVQEEARKNGGGYGGFDHFHQKNPDMAYSRT